MATAKSTTTTTQLVPFSFESNDVRVITHPDGSWSVIAKDVAEALEYSWNPYLLSHVPDEWKGTNRIGTLGGKQEMLTLTEEGLYFFIGRSDKPKALPFQKWVYGEVIPTIRQTGGYTLKPRTIDGVILKHRQAREITSTYLSIAKMFGTDELMARAIAADAVLNQTGLDVQRLLSGNVVAGAPMTATELGKLVDLSARKINALLALQGFQQKHPESGDWVPTFKGETYATCHPYKSRYSAHCGYKTLWYRTVLEVLDISIGEDIARVQDIDAPAVSYDLSSEEA